MKNGGFGARLACALLLAGALLQAACASMCRELAADREQFFARRAAASGPHAAIVVPFAVADRLIARRIATLRPLGSPIRLPGRIGTLLGSLRLAPRRMTLRPAPDDRLGLRLELDVLAGDTALFAVTIDLDLRPEVDVAKGVLRVAVRADDLRAVRPAIASDAALRLAAAIQARLPSLARSVLSPDEIALIARTSIDYLAGHVGTLLVTSGLASALGELTSVRVDIPIVPVSRLWLRSVRQGDRGALVVGVFTRLPAAVGVSMTAGREPQAVQVRLSGDALAELGNRALVTGLLPRRYDDRMHPKKDGDFTPGFRWVRGRRPVKLFAWRLESPCLRARIGADPIVGLRGGKLVVGVEHGEVEEVRGAMLVRARVWMKRIGAEAIRFTRRTIASARISIAGSPLAGRIENAFYRDGELGFDLVAE
jgi:hypothetical protein